MELELNRRMEQLAEADLFPFHMPGHKGKFPNLFSGWDLTELPGLDNLHSPQHAIKRAQERVAGIYQAAKTYFLVNGSSVGLVAAIMSLTQQDDCILVPRSCHKSILAGLILSGAMPVWIEQTQFPHDHHWLPPTREQVERLFATNTIKAAVFTNPDYMGFVPDIAGLIGDCKLRGINVIVDEAHGAHLKWGSGLGLPLSAVAAGGDIVVQSAHKTLPALTQSAWLHLTDSALAETLQNHLNLLQTTSPSYLFLRSLEFAAAWAQTHGTVLLGRLKLLAKALSLKCAQVGFAPGQPISGHDWTKLLLPNRRGMTKCLSRRGIFPELVLEDRMLFMLTMADALHPRGIAVLHQLLPTLAALPELAETNRRAAPPPLPCQEITPREAWRRRGHVVALSEAGGRIARQILAPYPPGTMILGPGQRVGQDHVHYLQKLHSEKVIPGWLEVI